MKSGLSICILVVILFFTACDADYRRSAQGPISEILVVMDSTQWNSETAQAIRETFGGVIFTLPRAEERFDLRFMSLRTQRDLDRAQSYKNVIFAAPVNERTTVGGFIRNTLSDDILQSIGSGQNFMFPLRDHWFRDQWVLYLSARTDDELARLIRENEHTLINSVNQVEIARWQDYVYKRGEQHNLADSLWTKHGFKIRVQHDYSIGVDTTSFVTMRRYLPDNNRWIWFWNSQQIDSYYDFNNLDMDWINAKRDSINERRIRGTREHSFITTEYRRPVETRRMVLNGYQAYETRGTWQMTHDSMGGPFLHYTIWDAENDRIVMMEFSQFAPRYTKRRFVYQFEAMANTFKADPDFERRQSIRQFSQTIDAN